MKVHGATFKPIAVRFHIGVQFGPVTLNSLSLLILSRPGTFAPTPAHALEFAPNGVYVVFVNSSGMRFEKLIPFDNILEVDVEKVDSKREG